MARSILLLNGLFTFIIVTVYSVDKNSNDILYNIKPQHYNIKIKLRDEENIFFGECDINIQILKTTQQISMLSEKLGIITAILTNYTQYLPDQNKTRTHKVFSYIYDYENNTVKLYFYDVLSPGHYILNLRYSAISIKGGFQKFEFNNINDNAMNSSKRTEEDEEWLSATYFQPVWARRIFPCWPLSESTFNISVLHSQVYRVLSNMLIQTVVKDEENMQWTHFSNGIFAKSPYKIAIFVTNFVPNFIDKYDSVNMWCRKESKTSLQFALTIVRNTTLYLKNEWKYLQSQTVNYIVIPNFQEQNDSVMNLKSMISKEEDIMYDEEIDNIGTKYNVIYSVGNQVIREWLQSLDNPFYWPNSSLSEGFNMFFATHFLNQTFPNFRITDLFVVQIQHECLHFDVDNNMLPLIQRENVTVEFVNHMRTLVILRMLHHAFGEKRFWKSIHTYLDTKKYDYDSFWKTLKDTYIKENPTSDDINKMLYPWIKQKGYVFNAFRDHKYKDNKIEFSKYINISIDDLDILDENVWIPMSYVTQTYPNFNQTTPIIWFLPPTKKPIKWPQKYNAQFLSHKEDGWIMYNIQQIAYCRVNYDDMNWQKIAEYLNSKEYWKIHVLNRAQVIDDTFHFLLVRKLKPDIFWQLTRYLSHERDFIAWYPMLKAIKYMSSIFPFQEIGVIHIKEILQSILSKLMSNIDYKENSMEDDFTKVLREEAQQLICMLGKLECLEMANNLLQDHLRLSTKLLPQRQRWAYCYGLVKMNSTVWSEMLNKIKEDNDEILYLLTCPNHLVELNKYISALYTGDKLYNILKGDIYDNKLQEIPGKVTQISLRHFHFIVTNNTKSYETFNHLLNNFQYIKPSLINMPAALLILINNIHSMELLNEEYFFRPHFMDYKIYMPAKIIVRMAQLKQHMLLINKVEPTNETYAKF